MLVAKPVKIPEDMPLQFVMAWNTRKPEDIASLFTEDAEFVNVVGLWWHSRDAIFKAHTYGLKYIFNESILTLKKTKVKHLSETIAVVHAKMHLMGQTPIETDILLEDRTTIFSFIVQKNEEGWLCVSAQNTDIVPGAETHVIKDGNIKPVHY